MFIVDSQVHIWGANTPKRPWPENHVQPHRELPHGTDELLHSMDAAGVSRAVLVPPSWEGNRNDLVLEAIHEHPDRFAAMVRIDLEAANAHNLIVNWERQPGVLGL